MRGCRRARLLGGLLAAALMFLGDDSWAEDPTPTPTPVCTSSGRATNGCWEVPADVNQDMSVPGWADVEYQTNEIAELVMLRQDVIALRRYTVICFGALLGWSMMAYLFDAISGKR